MATPEERAARESKIADLGAGTEATDGGGRSSPIAHRPVCLPGESLPERRDALIEDRLVVVLVMPWRPGCFSATRRSSIVSARLSTATCSD